MEVFRTVGLRLSLDELADKMGVSRKTLYNHFESRMPYLGPLFIRG
jgi:AcrR family transcriptional regulator